MHGETNLENGTLNQKAFLAFSVALEALHSKLEANEDEGDFSYAISGSELQLDSRK
jgi:hypothetical protein